MQIQNSPQTTENEILVLGPRSTLLPPPTAKARAIVARQRAQAMEAIERERRILTADGVADGFAQIFTLVEDWRRVD